MPTPPHFSSPYAPLAGLQRLEQLAEKQNFYDSCGHFSVHTRIDAIERDGNSFRLFVMCSPQHFRLPAFLFFKLTGKMTPTSEGSRVQLELRLQPPFSTGDRLLFIFWTGTFLLALAGLIRIATAPASESLLSGFIILLAGMGYLNRLYRTYQLGANHILDLVTQTLQRDPSTPEKREISGAPEWIDSIIKEK
jgi:hypothetical protein